MCLTLIWRIFDMQVKDTRREIKSIDLLPLINVVFLLILFVLIAGRPTTNHPGEIVVPESRLENDYQGAAFTVILRADDLFYIDNRQLTLGELVAMVEDLRLAADGLPVELIADKAAHAKPLLAFRRAMARAGIGEIRLKTERAGGDG